MRYFFLLAVSCAYLLIRERGKRKKKALLSKLAHADASIVELVIAFDLQSGIALLECLQELQIDECDAGLYLKKLRFVKRAALIGEQFGKLPVSRMEWKRFLDASDLR